MIFSMEKMAQTHLFFEADSALNDLDQIADIDLSEDILDISDILDGNYNFAADVITDYVQITFDGTDSLLAVLQRICMTESMVS